MEFAARNGCADKCDCEESDEECFLHFIHILVSFRLFLFVSFTNTNAARAIATPATTKAAMVAGASAGLATGSRLCSGTTGIDEIGDAGGGVVRVGFGVADVVGGVAVGNAELVGVGVWVNGGFVG